MLAQVDSEEPGKVRGFREEANLRLEVSFTTDFYFWFM